MAHTSKCKKYCKDAISTWEGRTSFERKRRTHAVGGSWTVQINSDIFILDKKFGVKASPSPILATVPVFDPMTLDPGGTKNTATGNHKSLGNYPLNPINQTLIMFCIWQIYCKSIFGHVWFLGRRERLSAELNYCTAWIGLVQFWLKSKLD